MPVVESARSTLASGVERWITELTSWIMALAAIARVGLSPSTRRKSASSCSVYLKEEG